MSNDDALGPLTRRRFGVGALTAAAASAVGGLEAREEVAAESGVLADYVRAADPATRIELVSEGEWAGGRYRTLRLVSQSWRGAEWTHELSLFLPGRLPADTGTMLLWIDGGAEQHLRTLGPKATDTLKTLAVAANAAGLPGAVVRQVPFQPMFDGLYEDDLVAHTFVEYVRTGDASWPLLLPMVKAAVEAMNAASAEARDRWGLDIDGFVVTGASKRGWTTWLTAAVDDRVRGAMPMVIDLLSLERHVVLQRASFGGLSEKLVPYASRGVEQLIDSPRGRDLCGIVDPYTYRDRIVQPKIIALGTNDPYWPLESLSLYLDGLAGPRWVSYAPNAGHNLPLPRVGGLVAALGRHVAGDEPLPVLDWSVASVGDGVVCMLRTNETPDEVALWTATADTRDFRQARWRSTSVPAVDGGWRATFARPERGWAAALVEARYPREPLPLLLTTSIHVQRAS